MTSLRSLFAPALMSAALTLTHPAAAFAQNVGSDSSFTPRDFASDSTFDESQADTLALPPPEALPAPSVVPVARSTDVLPFAKNDLPRRSFAVGFGGGIGTYVADLEDVDHAFRQIEDAFRAAGAPVPRSGKADLEPMRIWFGTLHFEKVVDLSLQLGRSNGTNDQLRTTGALASRRIVASGNGDVALTAGAGYGGYGFVFKRNYGTTISSDSNGGYTTLDSITLEGGGTYWTGRGSFLVRPNDHIAIDLQAQYLGMSEASTETSQGGPISINLGGYLFGASITLFL
jgi:hypothetical protein